ncbi:hypothetical protein K9O30_20280 [Clostridium bowmanii]|uniref:hypothetical protein n=1 Tax=Clostridium bowmanii TaxID=132925 RepID=UPI001C0DA8E6|nr:hypothetical protein [Clostridium bowmanii]MBU3191701.1 hypothetical protein [Clostridium bowmanii]MCA1076013.1 hypothetical protein [Clostridium bowmanii]
MLNINDKMDRVENMVESDNVEEVTQNQVKYEFDNSSYKVNYFGIGREAEEWQ